MGKAIKRLQSKDWVDLQISSLSTTNPYLSVNYEDFLHSRWPTIERVMNFLNCDAEMISSMDYKKQKKQSRGSPSDYIANITELEGAIASRWSQ